ncbi:hypothetical protein HNY73_000293 [Argiope bruennichi]|uniref:Uncharacterized protein n=1 Tax=Argiope bruennichi TaxID=94029 RepID=A0A8T0G1J4_ARGBR|nr:hypothetical protein HNY73_000293 [Argiope bruennichi]
MRAMLSAFCVAGVLATVVSSSALSREKRYAGAFSSAGFPFGVGGMAYAGPRMGSFGGFGNNNPTGAQVFNPFDMFRQDGFFNLMPMPFVVPVPIPSFPVFKNWYEGENVCKEEKILNTQMPDDVIPDDWKDDMPNINTDFSHEQETCKGTDKKYVCVKRVMGNNGEAQIKATKYECCHGFVRDPTGNPGCIENIDKVPLQ